SLYVKNYALIDELEIDFSERLNIITGETGAGKSIMLGALGLIMGKRADVKVLADETNKCIVEAKFDITQDGLQNYFEDNDLEYADELIIRREILPTGKSRAFINDSPATLDILQQLSDGLIDLHQQFDTLDLYKTSFQIKVLDALADNAQVLRDYQALLIQYRTKVTSLKKLISERDLKSKELDFLKYQLSELSQIKLQKGEYESLEEELDVLSSNEEIKSVALLLSNGLEQQEPSVISIVQEMVRQTASIQEKDKRFIALHDRLVVILEEVKDIANDAERIFEGTEYDGKRIDFVQERLAVIHKMFKKHQANTSEELLNTIEGIELKIKEIDGSDETITQFELQIQKMEQDLEKFASTLTKSRQGVVKGLTANILKVLSEMAMAGATFEVEIKSQPQFLDTGKDQVEFFFSANKGSKLQRLKDVASGGETSRFALAVKSIIANAMHLSTMIFDEIDTGISGEVAHRMGEIMKQLSEKHQIITITHSPQIAAKADNHYFVFKQEDGKRTNSAIKLLDEENKVMEIAKMLSGAKPSEAAIANAKSLINN
ncbi:MAG TPA: DNA repair protein RecN, partial [Saprospiraceae bacterium]|nr:DNA repair protein RecN [Saprospiraceae bacterium]